MAAASHEDLHNKVADNYEKIEHFLEVIDDDVYGEN